MTDGLPSRYTSPERAVVRNTASLGKGSLTSCSSTVNVAFEPVDTIKEMPSYSPGLLEAASVSGVGDGSVVPAASGDVAVAKAVPVDDVELASATTGFTVIAPEPDPEPEPGPTPGNPPDVPDKPIGEVTGKGQVALDRDDVEGATYYQVGLWDANDCSPVRYILPLAEALGQQMDEPDRGFYQFLQDCQN